MERRLYSLSEVMEHDVTRLYVWRIQRAVVLTLLIVMGALLIM